VKSGIFWQNLLTIFRKISKRITVTLTQESEELSVFSKTSLLDDF